MKRQAPHETQQPQLQPAHPAHALQALQPQPAHPRQPLHPLQPLHPRWAYCWPGLSSFLSKTSWSKTKNVPKLTSETSSSLRLICGLGTLFPNDPSGVGPRAPVAYAPPASAIDAPTAPATGKAFFRCFRFGFCFVWGMSRPPMPYCKCYIEFVAHNAIGTPSRDAVQDRCPHQGGIVTIAEATPPTRGRGQVDDRSKMRPGAFCP